MIKKRKFRDPRLYTSEDWRDTRAGAYRNFLSNLAKSKYLKYVAVGVFLLQLYMVNVVLGVFINLNNVVNNFVNGRSVYYRNLSRGLYAPYLFTRPRLALFVAVVTLITSIYSIVKFYYAFRALEDIQNASTNRWATTEELLNQYRLVWADPKAFFDGPGGVAIAHVRPSILKEFGMERRCVFDDQLLKDDQGLEVEAIVASNEDEKEHLIRNAEILRKELTEPENEYGLLLADENVNMCVFGITRAGKGAFFVNSTIDTFSRSKAIKERSSLFIADTKGIALRENYKMLKERDYEILVFNVADTSLSNPFNPLFTAMHNYEDYLKNTKLSIGEKNKRLDFAIQDLASLSHILYIRPKSGDRFFIDNARALFRAICIASIEHCLTHDLKHKLCLFTISTTLARMMRMKINRAIHPYLKKYVSSKRPIEHLFVDYQNKTALDVFFGEMEDTHPAKVAYASIDLAGGAEVTLAGIASEVIVALDKYVQGGNARVTATNAFDFRKLGFDEKPQAIFLIFPDSDSVNEELAALFIEQSFRVLVREADATTKAECERSVVYILDEFTNLMEIKDIDKKLSSALSRKIRFHLYVQSIVQLDKYGDSIKKAIVGNCGITAYIQSNEKETNDLISARLHNRTVASYTRQGRRFSVDKTETESARDVPLMSISELENMQFGENLIIRNMKKTDLRNNSITPYPILNRGTERMIPSFWYLKYGKMSWEDLSIDNSHVELSLNDYVLELDSAKSTDHFSNEEREFNVPLLEIEQYKQHFLNQIKERYKKDSNLYKYCDEVWDGETLGLMKATLFNDKERVAGDENLKDGLNRLMTASVNEFIQWLLAENKIESLLYVSEILELEKDGDNIGCV